MYLTRRDTFRVATAGAASTALAWSVGSPASAATGQFAGHKPGRIYVGVSGLGFDVTKNIGRVGLRRTFYKWDDGTRESRNIRTDHANNRLPWISFKPPGSPSSSWREIANGKYDNHIRARARRYASHSAPVIVTFNHEPQTDSAPPADFARAWCRIHDVMRNETGLKNVISAPILGSWAWHDKNRRDDPADWITPAVLNRCHFLGTDVYQMPNGETYRKRVADIVSWLDARGYRDMMVGIGETGCSDDFSNIKGGPWWTDSWKWTVSNRDRIFAIAYFNTRANNRQGYNWLLTQSGSKVSAFKTSVQSSTATLL